MAFKGWPGRLEGPKFPYNDGCWTRSTTATSTSCPAPTQQPFQSEAIAILRIADGKVAEVRGTADRLGMLTQLGILPDIG